MLTKSLWLNQRAIHCTLDMLLASFYDGFLEKRVKRASMVLTLSRNKVKIFFETFNFLFNFFET